mgnify:CR=1 FL=1
MTHNKIRPLSPHWTIWRPGVWMAVSITHRITGVGLSLVGLTLLVWWLAAIAAGPAAYAVFIDTFTGSDGGLNILGYVIFVGLTWAAFQHIGSGIRHLFQDIGAGYELRKSARSALAVYLFSPVATALFWAYLLLR